MTDEPTGTGPLQTHISTHPLFLSMREISGLLLLVGAAAYFVGFIVSRSYLSKYAIVPYDFLQTTYISAGILYLATTAGLTSIIWFVHRQIHKTEKDKAVAWDHTGWAVFALFFAILQGFRWLIPTNKDLPEWYGSVSIFLQVFAFVIMTWGHKYLSRLDRLQKYLASGLIAYAVFVVMAFAFAFEVGFLPFSFYPAFLLSLLPLSNLSSASLHPVKRFVEPLTGLGLLLTSMLFFGKYYYPTLPAHYGGGHPVLVSLALKDDNRQKIGRLLDREDWKCLMQNLAVVYETNEALYLLPYGTRFNDSVVAIARSEIAGLVYQRSELRDNFRCDGFED